MPVITATLLALLMSVSSLHNNRAQRGAAPCASGPTTMLEYGEASARVFGVYTARQAADGSVQLCLLVLWRGEVNWYRHRAAVLEALNKRKALAADVGAASPLITYYRDLGDIIVSLDYDWKQHRAELAGQVIELGDANVVLVDGVDRADSSAMTLSRLRIPAALAGTLPDVRALAIRDPNVKAFLE